jgi:thiol-disulfide isomerase/thioredoxin
MQKFLLLLLALAGASSAPNAQALQSGRWHATLSRPGGLPVYFTFEVMARQPRFQLQLYSASDTILVEDLHFEQDSLFFSMPVFESDFRLKLISDSRIQGIWLKGTAAGVAVWDFVAEKSDQPRIPGPGVRANKNISGRWQMQFVRKDGTARQAVGEFVQQQNRVTGTIVNPSGDYRYLEGAVRGDSLYLTTFDGAHSYAFVARISSDSTLADGRFFAGTAPGDQFSALRSDRAALAPTPDEKYLSQPVKLDFAFPATNGQRVSINDSRFQNKVVVVQLMGSWCPNCMDETRFLSELYNSGKWKDVEMVGLAYELSTDFNRSANSVKKFEQRFQVQYPMLITGVTSGDTTRAQKTLPPLKEIKYFPTTLFIDKKGMLRKIHSGFQGPGAPAYFEAFKQEFFETVEKLRAE